ncbi:hypothetical protein BAY60_19040 [Prauserella muralis]|uniref:Solute-binding protein family 5 domain-containing protein n=1 Tax=Prauserella muralis TaxID=588067 RepID=A0A2V4B652_9PSEU|nr:hypothetical protein BAY60_19040 [Prauserella muralis]
MQESGQGGAATKPVRGGTLVTTVASEPVPGAYFTGRPGNIFWSRNVLEPLLLLDDSGKEIPLLATDWSLSQENRVFTATLREGVKFHSGRPFTADDVVFSLEREMAGDGLASLKGAMEGWQVKATGKHTVTIESPRPLQEIVTSILDVTPIIDRETYRGLEDGSEVIGTGPFLWSEYRAGTDLVMKRNGSYWEDGLPYLDGVEVTVIKDSTAQLAALRSGRVQIANGLSTEDAKTIVDDSTYLLNAHHGLLYGVAFDVTQPPFDDVDLRHAVAYAIDRDRINNQVMGGLAGTSALPWSEDVTGYPKDLAGTYSYQPDKARQLVEKAGARGTSLQIDLHNLPVPRKIYEILARNLSDVGLRPSPRELSIADFEPQRSAGKLGPAYLIWSATAGLPPALMLDALAELRPEGNTQGYRDAEYQRLAQALIDSPDESATASRLRDLSQKMLDDAVFLPYAYTPLTDVQTSSVRDMVTGRYGRLMRAAYLAK